MRLFLAIIILNLSLLFAFNLGLAPVQADITFKPNVTFGPLTKGVDYTINPNSIGNYVLGIYKFAINIVGILAVVVMMWGGLTWITAGGNAGRVDSAKAWIGAAATGLVLTLASYTILMTINPNLGKFESLNITRPGEVKKCCSEKIGGFFGFPTTINNQITYSCIPPENQKEKYGDVKECSEKTKCTQSGGKYVCASSILKGERQECKEGNLRNLQCIPAHNCQDNNYKQTLCNSACGCPGIVKFDTGVDFFCCECTCPQ